MPKYQIYAKYASDTKYGIHSDKREQRLGIAEAKNKTEALRNAKRYLTTDFKAVRVVEL